MSSLMPDKAHRGRLQFLLITALFVAPVIFAWFSWQSAVNEGVGNTTNAGELVRPARPLTAVPMTDAQGVVLEDGLLKGRWSYVLFASGDCDALCQEKLYLTRQVRTSVNKDMHRVHRVLVVRKVDQALMQSIAQHQDLSVAVLDEAAWKDFGGQFPSSGDGEIFLIDPLGNLMMKYAKDIEANGVLKDLRKLLKISQVG